jgi:hypothetical protein
MNAFESIVDLGVPEKLFTLVLKTASTIAKF